ncbi:MAG: biotin/lipoyl-containing protein, partial [Mycobacteriaceae bacterium]
MPEVQMPRLSDTMTDGILSRWLKHEGDEIHKGDVIAEIETDKATMELEAYDDGPLTALLVTEGTTVPIGAPIAVIGGAATSPQTPPPTPPPPTAVTAEPAAQEPNPTTTTPAVAVVPAEQASSLRRASPLVRKLAHDHGIDLSTIPGTGPGGRIVRADLETTLEAVAGTSAPALPVATAPVVAVDDP